MEEEVEIEGFTSGTIFPGTGYRYFLPEKVNREWRWNDPQLNKLLERASIQLGGLNSYAKLVPDVDRFIELHVLKEALVSSRIEGTQTNIDEALMEEDDVPLERRDDWKEVQNYTKAMNYAIEELEDLPLSSRLLRKTHELLMSGVRGEHKNPGEYRRSQNWTGGASIDDAVFIPPSHEHVSELMGDLEKFLHNRDIHAPSLVRIGIAHYQFETIHPFLDGNGRIGRLMITLYLMSEGILERPLLYLSTFFDKDKELYYDNLMKVREKNDLLQWMKYFLTGIEEASKEATSTLSQVVDIKTELESRIRESWGRRAHNALTLLDHLFQKPSITAKQVQDICDLSPKAAGDLIKGFVDEGILEEVTGRTRNRIYRFEQYVSLFRS